MGTSAHEFDADCVREMPTVLSWPDAAPCTGHTQPGHHLAAIGSSRPTRNSQIGRYQTVPRVANPPARRQEACLKSQGARFELPPRTPQTDAVKTISATARQSAAVDAFPDLEVQV